MGETKKMTKEQADEFCDDLLKVLRQMAVNPEQDEHIIAKGLKLIRKKWQGYDFTATLEDVFSKVESARRVKSIRQRKN